MGTVQEARPQARAILLLAAALTAPMARAELPPQDRAASAWLNADAPRLYAQARDSILLSECRDGGARDNAVHLMLKFNRAAATLPPADEAYAQRVFIAGQADANAAARADKAGACRGFTSQDERSAQALLDGRAGFWDAP